MKCDTCEKKEDCKGSELEEDGECKEYKEFRTDPEDYGYDKWELTKAQDDFIHNHNPDK